MTVPISPFDQLIATLSNDYYKNVSQNYQYHDVRLGLCRAFLAACRNDFVRMQQAASNSRSYWDEKFKHTGGETYGKVMYEELLTEQDMGMETKASYFAFIDDLNRYGRILARDYGFVIPTYYRIRFYRNKVVEHWDSYALGLASPDGSSSAYGKIAIPSHGGMINRPAESAACYSNLQSKFKTYGISLPADNSHMDPVVYSDQILTHLEKISPQLKIREKYDDLVEALFIYCFPVPVHDIETYSERLTVAMTGFTESPNTS